MKCPVCRKQMKKRKDVMEQDGVEFEAYECPGCGEELLDMNQLKDLAKKYRKLRGAKEVTFSKWGNSLAVRIPVDVADTYKISAGSHGMLVKDKEAFKIIPVV